MWPRHHGRSRPSTSLVCTAVTITAAGNPVTGTEREVEVLHFWIHWPRPKSGLNLVVPWIRICLLMQGTWVWSPGRCQMPRSDWAHTQLLSHNSWTYVLQLLQQLVRLPRAYALRQEKPPQREAWAPQPEKARGKQGSPSTDRSKFKEKKKDQRQLVHAISWASTRPAGTQRQAPAFRWLQWAFPCPSLTQGATDAVWLSLGHMHIPPYPQW